MKRFFKIVIFLFLSSVLYAQNKNVLILVSYKLNEYNKLNSSEQLYFRSALQTFVGNLTLIDGISVRTDANDENLRKIQKKSQIEAAQGLGSVNSAYVSDLISKADLNVDFFLSKYKQGYKIGYSASEIESLKIISSDVTDSYFNLENIDKETDFLSYSLLKDLNGKKIINSVPYNVKLQLTHTEDSSESYKKYIIDLSKQIENDKSELEKIEKENLNKSKKNETLRKQQALKLKIQAAENAKRKTEESLHRQQEKIKNQQKQTEELKALVEQKKNKLALKFEEIIKKSQTQQLNLNKELSQGLSIEKRIELIENDKQSLMELKEQLEQKKSDNRNELKSKMNEEIGAINKENWKLGEKDALGNPIESALLYRENKCNKIKEKYNKLISSAEADFDDAFSASIKMYQKQIEDGLYDLENTDFIFRSYENGSLLNISVGNYDGANSNWKVTSDFGMKNNGIIIGAPNLEYLDCFISYEDITGKKTVKYNNKNEDAYEDYMDSVELADLCFRTDTPYIYGELFIKVKYNESLNHYELSLKKYNISKMEDGKVIKSFSGKEYYSIVDKDFERQIKEKKEINEKKQKERERKQKEYEKELARQEREDKAWERTIRASKLRVKWKYFWEDAGEYWKPDFTGLFANCSVNYSKPFYYDSKNITSSKTENNVEFLLKAGAQGFYLLNFASFNNIGFGGISGYNHSWGIGAGTGVKFGCLKPYAEASIGLLLDNSFDFRFTTNTKLGVSVLIKKLSIDLFWNNEWRFFENVSDSKKTLGIGIGINFDDDITIGSCLAFIPFLPLIGF